MELNGIAHIQLSVNNFQACSDFYRALFGLLEMRILYDSEDVIYGIGSRTGILVTPAAPEFRTAQFEQNRIGLHHFCLRARTPEDVDTMYEFLRGIDATIVRSPAQGPWAPGYYSILFEDPDGIRIEVNYVPGKGHLGAERDSPAISERPR